MYYSRTQVVHMHDINPPHACTHVYYKHVSVNTTTAPRLTPPAPQTCPQAAVLPTPLGPVAVLGPSVDELRRLLMSSRTELTRGAYEPGWCGACGPECGGSSSSMGQVLGSARRVDGSTWRELLAAAEQLVNV
jgi:hypothetical protein